MSWRQPLLAIVTQSLPLARAEPVDDQKSLTRDLGMDSFEMVQLVSLIDQQAGRRVPLEDLFFGDDTGQTLRVGSLIKWLDDNYPLNQA